ncbi:MAG: ATP-binding protein [Elusimicrobia bacterium]|nr:ATP-binding protein [Elusimicrobiota bacterium]
MERGAPVYLDLELTSDWARLENAQMFLEPLVDRLVVIDEVQRRPDLFALLRSLIDQKRKAGRFLLLGSADLLALRQMSESLAGRIQYLELSGFLRSEVKDKAPIERHWLRGGYPQALFGRSDRFCREWLEALIRSYLERDLVGLGFHAAAPELRRFWTMLAHNHGQLLNSQQLASSFGVSPPTINHYRSILEQMLLVRALAPWHANLKKRLVRAPRIYIRDSGLLHALLSISDRNSLLAHPAAGKSWEGFALEQILSSAGGKAEGSFFRTHAGAEIDLILHKGLEILAAVEIKLGFTPQLTRGFYQARQDLGNPPAWVIYSGADRYRLKPGVEAIGLDEFVSSALPKIL